MKNTSSNIEPSKSHIDVKTIHSDTQPPESAINNDDPNISSTTSTDTGIFNKLSSIWTKRNENTASDSSSQKQQNKNQTNNIVQSFKKLFKN